MVVHAYLLPFAGAVDDVRCHAYLVRVAGVEGVDYLPRAAFVRLLVGWVFVQLP